MRIKEIFEADCSIDEGTRVDIFISMNSSGITRSQLKTRNAEVFINGEKSKLSRIVIKGDTVVIEYDSSIECTTAAENISLEIIYEDKNIIVVNKPQGMVVHPAAGNYTGTLVNALLYHANGFENSFNDADIDPLRPGIVHRLDKDTSGVLIAAKNFNAHEFLSRQFRSRKVKKKYLAVVKGRFPTSSGIIENSLLRSRNNRKKYEVTAGKGKISVTRYRLLKEFDDSTLAVLEPETGRTHQLRVHMQHIGCPIIGDSLYSRNYPKYSSYNLMLHALRLEIIIPDSGYKIFTAPVPERFKSFLKNKFTEIKN